MHNGAALQQHQPHHPPSQQQQQPPPPGSLPGQQPQQMTAVQALAQANEQTWLLMGAVAEQLSDLDRAQAAYEHALRHNPASVSALTQVAGIARAKDDFGKAIEFFQRVLNISQDNGEIWGALGHCYLMMDDLQKAYTAYQQALYHLPNPKEPKLWYGIGILYDRYGSLEHAEDAFSSVLRMDPNFEKANEIYFRLGIIYKQQHKYPASLDCFKYILKNPPRPLTDVDIWFQIGHVYEQQKEFIYAKEAYERVLTENPEHSKVLQQLGWLYHQRDATFTNQEMAVSYLEKSLASDRSDAQTWYLLGRVFMSGQRYNKAYEYYQQAVYRDGRNPTFWCSIGVLYYQINQFRDALDAYSRAIRLNPYISEVWFDLGSLYESCNNQITDAIDAYGRALDLDPNNPTIKTRLSLLRNLQQNGGPPPIPPPPRDVHPTAYANSGPAGTLGPAPSSIATGPQGRPGSSNPMLIAQQAPHTLGARPDQPGMPPAGSAYHPGAFPPGGPGQQHPPSRMTSPSAPLTHGRPDDRSARHGPTPMDVDRVAVGGPSSAYGQQRVPSGGRPLFDARSGAPADSPRMRGASGYPPPPSASQQPYTNPYPPYTSAPPGVHHPSTSERPGMSPAEVEWERAREKNMAGPYGPPSGYYPPPANRGPPSQQQQQQQQDSRRASDERNGDPNGARRGSLGRSPYPPMPGHGQPAHPYYGNHPQEHAKPPAVAGPPAPPVLTSAGSAARIAAYHQPAPEGYYRHGIDRLIEIPTSTTEPTEPPAAVKQRKKRGAAAAPGEEKEKKPRKSRASAPEGADKEPKRRGRKATTQDPSLKVTLSTKSRSNEESSSAAQPGQASPSRSDDSSIRGATPAAPSAAPSRFVDENYDDDDVLSDTGGAADLLMGLAGGFSFSNSRGAPAAAAVAPPPPGSVAAPAPPPAPSSASGSATLSSSSLRQGATASTAPPLFPSASPAPAAAPAARSPAPSFANPSASGISTLSVPASDERTSREDSAPAPLPVAPSPAPVPEAANPLKRDHEDLPAEIEGVKRPKIEDEGPVAIASAAEGAAPVSGSPMKVHPPSAPTAAAPSQSPAPTAAPLPA